MKLAYSNTGEVSGHDLMKQAKEMEQSEQIEKAIPFYQKMIKKHYRREYAYQRLMIIYRKLKEYKKELATVNEAIDEFSKILFRPEQSHTKKIEMLSRKLIRSTGLADKKDISVYQPQPIAGWQNRKKRLERLLNKRK